MSILTNIGGAINTGQPVNWAAPLNRGLVSWWMAINQGPYFGGNRFLDLCGRNHGSLTNGPTWTGALGRPGGWGALSFDGTDDYVGITPPMATPNIEAAKTITGWFQWGVINERRIIFSMVKDDTAGASNSIDVEITTGNHLSAVSWGGVPIVGVNIGGGGGLDLALNTWHHFAYTDDETTHTIYVNGISRMTDTTARQTGSTGVIRIGSFNSAFPSPYYNRPGDDYRLYDRALSASEVWVLYQASRLGYPNELNWLPRRRYAVQDAGGGGGTAARYLTLLGVG